MSSTFAVAEIIADIANLTNVPPFSTSTNITQAQVLYWISQSARSLSALLQQTHGSDREFVQTATRTTSPGYALVSLPDECDEVQSVLWERGERDLVLLIHANADDLQSELDPGIGWAEGCPPRWRIEGETIALYPFSDEAETLRIYYTTHISAGGDSFNARLDFDRWVTLDVCAKVATARKRDPSGFLQDKGILERALLSRARKRQPEATHTIRDVRYQQGEPYGGRWWKL